MPGRDERVDFLSESIASICGCFAGAEQRRGLQDALEDSRDVSSFLDDPSLASLKAVVYPASRRMEFTSKLGVSLPARERDDEATEVVFVRRNNEPLTPANVARCLEVHSVQGSPLDGLYNTLRAVWCPTLLQNAQLADKLPPRVQQLLSELEQTLSTAVRIWSRRIGFSRMRSGSPAMLLTSASR